MSDITTRDIPAPASTSALLAVWLGVAVVLTLMLAAGATPNADSDDALKMQEIRHLLATGDIFDRVIPGVAQPGPMVSHWPWIVDAPYALIAALLDPLIGGEGALQAAAFAVPLVLLLFALATLQRIVGLLGFARPATALALSAVVSLTALVEFQPMRVDYHSLQMLLLLCAVGLTMRSGSVAPALNGAVAGLSVAISAEIAPFLAIPMAFYAWRFIRDEREGDDQLRAFGVGLAATSIAAFLAVTAPAAYWQAACDRYSLPHLFALGSAGLVFAVVPSLSTGRGDVSKFAMLAGGAILSIAALMLLFPVCLDGPYGSLSPYLHENWLLQIEQERSIFASPEFLREGRLTRFSLAFLGAAAAVVIALTTRRGNRRWLVLALFAGVGLALSLAYLRYVRFLPLFAGPGFIVAVYALLPQASPFRGYLALEPDPNLRKAHGYLMLVPAAAALSVIAAYLAMQPASVLTLKGVDVASLCNDDDFGGLVWPAGARLLAPPAIGVSLLGEIGAPSVVAVPFHTAAEGLERSYRFFDPATPDPRAVLRGSQASYIAVCKVEGGIPTGIAARLPLAAALVSGEQPAWLEECPLPTGALLRIYRVVDQAQPAPACPSPR